MNLELTTTRPAQTRRKRVIGKKAAMLGGLSALEASLCAVILAGCFFLHFVPTYLQFGTYIVVILACISFATPISGILFLSAAQVIPDVPNIPFSCAQLALLSFVVWQVIKGTFLDIFRFSKPLCVALAPFFIWTVSLATLRGNLQFGLFLLFAVATGCAVIVLVKQSGNRVGLSLAAFLAGHALAMCLFWILKLNLGVPVQAFDIWVYGDSMMEGARIGTARGNANVLGPPMALVCIGAIGWFLSQPKLKLLPSLIGFAALIAAFPPLVGSGSRGGLVSVAAGVVVLILGSLSLKRIPANAPLMFVGVLFIGFVGWQRLGLDDHWQQMLDRQKEEEEDVGGIAAGRSLEWGAAWGAILNSPVIGGGQVVKQSYDSAPELWLSHSTYLDAGLAGGLPGMAMFCWFVFQPIPALWRLKHRPEIFWLLSVYAVSFVSNGSTSAIQLKHFWMLWGIVAAALSALTVESTISQRHKTLLMKDRKAASESSGQVPAV